jgi:endonuclease/exonuclease/phosphatase family metal-dependent hydrolase
MQLRILTLNVWNTDGDPRRFAVLNRELRRLAPDLIAFQEVIAAPERRQLDELLDGLDHHRTHQADVMTGPPPGAERYGGTAVATRWPHRIAEVLDFRALDAPDVPWCTLPAIVSLPDGDELCFVATTMSWRLDQEAARERQVLALTELEARHRRDLPTVIAGDFNATPDAASMRFLCGLQSLAGRSVCFHDAWAVAGDGPGHTWNIDNPNARSEIDQVIRQPEHRRRIDYVLVGSWHAHPRARCRIRSAALAFDRPSDDGVWASDHFGVVVDVEVGRDR